MIVLENIGLGVQIGLLFQLKIDSNHLINVIINEVLKTEELSSKTTY